MAVVISIGGRAVKEPSDFEMQRFNLTKSGRTAAGNMVMDLIAKKKKFLFTYETISGIDLKNLLEVIDSDQMFFQIQYLDDFGTPGSAIVYVGDISYKKFRSQRNGWYWKNLNFNLIEQ